MKRQAVYTTLICLASSFSTQAVANPTWAAYPAWSRSSDSDGLVIHKWSAGVLPTYNSGLSWRGVELQKQNYAQNGNTLTGQSIHYTAQEIDATSGMGYAYKVGVNQGPQQSLVTGDVNWNQAYNEQLQWGLFAGRDWVESMRALENNVRYDLVGANVDYQIHPRVTLIGALAHTHFSDGQDRQQQRARIVWDAWPEQGITLQASQKHQLGAKDVTPRLYFNPERLDETMGIVGWRRRMQGWQWYVRLGRGHQKVDHDNATPARLAELQLSSPVHGNSFFKLRMGENETYGLNGPGYSYRYADVQWIWRLDR